ncbi:Haloalkane dehalogenase 2 [Paraburkholderia graminis C4D1M]|uniref:Alpha/beta hydrolase fold n=1 Tax=Paraburkholderia graminis (strain ATCC 700544 / DSM 17151 / LMG 18924 / NCIMB 13744 / C4D1M) TaxID=396598 RepID=B1G156_PARG4|nr:alpha/beta hydrolase [Paraburkholderia graminis]EDT10296.1 alpha/beta hydrolase fold [Paraburkholderia graminis C4D1M]CAB3661354.1 Haloalkane dehalogenase 2 [Paraburkholderia graminis C4D1M]
MDATRSTFRYSTVNVDGVDIFYREAGPKDAPTLLLLHGFPSSSRMYEPLMPFLAPEFRVIAPDYPGFGNSEAPSPESYAYTFDNIARSIEQFADALKLDRYVLFMADYGGPVGFRLAMARPDKVKGIVIQNAVAHEEGLGPLWETRKAFWKDRAQHEASLWANLASPDALKLRHVGTSPNPQRYDPDNWRDEEQFLARPGQAAIQTDLFYDYRTNLESYPRWQAWLREHRPPTLVTWGKYDPSFTVHGAHAYKRDVPDAEVHVLDAGHFALEEASDDIAALTLDFMRRVWAR